MASWILVNVGSSSCLSPIQRQAIALTNADMLSKGPLEYT